MDNTNSNDNGQLVYCYDLHVNGIFGRNRKVKRELFTVAKHLPNQLTKEAAIELMDAKIKELKFKGNYVYVLKERKGRIRNEGSIQIYSTMLFQDSAELARGEGDN